MEPSVRKRRYTSGWEDYAMMIVMVAMSGVCLVAGLLLAPAVYGVGALAAACLFGILARIAQAGDQHAELMRVLSQTQPHRAIDDLRR